MAGSALPVAGSVWPSRDGCRTWSLTIDSNVEFFMPSRRDWANASSRLGPTVPLVPARASVWQEPHRLRKSFLPLTTLACSLDRLHPVAVVATIAQQHAATAFRPLSMAAES